MSDVFTVLGKDHLEVKRILTELAADGPGAGPLAEKLVIEESKHEAAEEMHFWPTVREKVPGGDQLADTALGQEQEGKEVLDKLRKAEPGDSEFVRLVATFAEAGEAHISYEETQVWPALRAVLSTEEALELGKQIEAAKEKAPTRPHPGGPDSATGQKTVGMAAGAVDKMRDAMSDRG
jgi:hypothetical protein